MAGRANSSKLTADDTGLPGRPKTGTSATTPKAKGLAGFTATCIHRISPTVSSTTRDEVDVAHRHPAAT